jgi:soluble lytic murein transglycosylase-like protein
MRFCFQFGAFVCVFAVAGCAAARAEGGYGTHAKIAGSKAVPVERVDPRSGQPVRTIVVAPTRAVSAPVTNASADPSVKSLVQEAAQKYDVSPALIDSVIQVESNYNPSAVSPKGALGLMQLLPDTARRFGVRDVFDPRDNILGGVRYLKFLQDTFKDDRLAVAAYNAGEGAVSKYNGVPPFPETVNYVAKVGQRYTKAKSAAARRTVKTGSAPKTEKPPQPEYAPVRQYQDAQGRIYLTTQ